MCAALALASCGKSEGSDPTTPESTVQPELVLLEYGRLADVYGLQVIDGESTFVPYQRDVVIGADIEDQRATGSDVDDGAIRYDFFGNDPDTLQPRLLITREIGSDGFTEAFEALDEQVRTITPMRAGDGSPGNPFSVVPRNAAIRLTFSSTLGVDDSFFTQRDANGRVTGLLNTQAVQVLRILGDPEGEGGLVPLPARVRVVAGGRQLVIDPVLLGGEGLEYQTSNNPAGLPSSDDQLEANIRIALALEGPLALPSLRSRRNGPITGNNNARVESIVRDFRAGNADDTSADISRGFVRDNLPLRIVGSLPFFLESVDDIDDSTQEVTLYKNGLNHEIDQGDVLRILLDRQGTETVRAEVITDPEDDRGVPEVQHVRVRIRRVARLRDADPRSIAGYPSDLAQREPWLTQNAPQALCVCEFSAGGIDGGDEPRNFLTFTPAPIALDGVRPPSDEFISPYAGAVVRFTKPVDLDSAKWADTLFFGMRDLTSDASRDAFIQSTGMDPDFFDEAKYRTPYLVSSRLVDEDGSQTILRLQPTDGFFLNDAMRDPNTAVDYRYFLHIVANSPDGGIRDLAGNSLDLQGTTAEGANSAVVAFTLDTRSEAGRPLFENNLAISVVRRFASRDEDANPSPFLAGEVRTPGSQPTAANTPLEDLFGAFLNINGRLKSRPTTRTRTVVDNFNQSPPIQQPETGPQDPLAWCPRQIIDIIPNRTEGQLASSPTGNLAQGPVQNPINPAGCRLQTLWREIDMGLSRDNPFDFNIDIEQMYWAPFAGNPIYFDEFDRMSLRLGHSEYRPVPCVGDFSSLPSLPLSGLRARFDDNFLRNQLPTGDGSDAESRAPQAVAYTDQGLRINPFAVVAAPAGPNRFMPLPGFQEPYFVWRDETVAEQGADSGGGSDQTTIPTFQVNDTYAPYLLSPFNMGQASRTVDGATGVQIAQAYWNDSRNYLISSPSTRDNFTGGLVGSIGLPLLADFQTFLDSSALPEENPSAASGINGWQTSLTVQSDPTPRFRVLSAGRPAGAPQGILPMGPSDPGWQSAVGGWAPVPGDPSAPWTITPGASGVAGPLIRGDNTLYWTMLDMLRRRTVVTSGFVDINNPHRVPEGFADTRLGPYFLAGGNVTTPADTLPAFDYSFDPPRERLPAGTDVVPQFRAATAVDPNPWYWQRWIETENELWPETTLENPSLTAAQREQLRPTADNFPLDPFKAGDAHIRKWDTRAIPGTSLPRNWWAYPYNRAVSSYVEEPADLMESDFLAPFGSQAEPFRPADVRYINWRFLMQNNSDAATPIDPSIETFALSYRFEPR
ncbi:MAG: hypothetical protein AB8H80_08875 [Planctomycetota bacterium]